MVKPYVLIATHKRQAITEQNVEGILKHNVGVILIVSDWSELRHFKKIFPSIEVHLQSNKPLGLKWQFGVDIAKYLDADPLIINGSDDLLCAEFFTRATKYMAEGYEFMGMKSWYVYDLKKVYLFDYLNKMPLGGGRVYSKTLLQKIDYQLFDKGRDFHLDDLGWNNVVKSLVNRIVIDRPLLLSVKGKWPALNPMAKMLNNRNSRLIETVYNVDPILNKFNYVRH